MQEGNISEWNEGNFKSMRLHQAQSIINYSKLSPLTQSEFGAGFNYNLWITNIDILYEEGKPKYKSSEIETVDKVKKLIESLIKLKPPHIQVYEASISGTRTKYVLNKENWESLKRVAELFESLVRLYNDKHGLSTRNRDEDDGL